MEKQFHVKILTPENRVFEGEVVSLVVPAALGYLGVLAGHAPLIAGLMPGKIIVRQGPGLPQVIRNKGKGFLEVIDNQATLLLDSV